MMTREEFFDRYALKPLIKYEQGVYKAKNLSFHGTSGTTHKKAALFVNYRDKNFFLRFKARWMHPIKRHLLVLNRGFSSLHYTIGALYYGRNTETVLVIGKHDYTSSLPRLLSELQPDGVLGAPTALALLIQALKKSVLTSVCVLSPIGELHTAHARALWKKFFPRAAVLSSYGVNEIGGTIGEPQPACDPSKPYRYHPAWGVTFSILKPNKEGIGEIAVTKRITPHDRVTQYCTGDMGRLLSGRCVCGARTTLELLGRRDFDYITIGTTGLTLRAVEEGLSPLRPHMEQYKIEIKATGTTRAPRYDIDCRIKASAHVRSLEKFKRRCLTALCEGIATTDGTSLGIHMDTGLIGSLKVQVTRKLPASSKEVIKEVRMRRV